MVYFYLFAGGMMKGLRCEKWKDCGARGYCRHSGEHEAFVPWKPEGGTGPCNEGHECNMAGKWVLCKEVEDGKE